MKSWEEQNLTFKKKKKIFLELKKIFHFGRTSKIFISLLIFKLQNCQLDLQPCFSIVFPSDLCILRFQKAHVLPLHSEEEKKACCNMIAFNHFSYKANINNNFENSLYRPSSSNLLLFKYTYC